MTWVVGGSSALGYGAMLSDVRISFADGSEADLLRKAYPVGPFILAAFAGSVRIGMQLIGHLQEFLDVPELDGQHAWQPEFVAEQWAPIASELFKRSPGAERDLGSQILMVGVSPNENLGLPEFPRIYVTKMSWPDFEPVHQPRGSAVSHIGSGSFVDKYEKSIGEFFAFGTSAMVAGLQAGATEWAQMLGLAIALTVDEHPVPGISPHVFVDVVGLGYLSQGTNDRKIHEQDGKITEFFMPRVAETYKDFIALCQIRKKSGACAVA